MTDLPVIPDHALHIDGRYMLSLGVYWQDWMLVPVDLEASVGTIFETLDGSWEWDKAPAVDEDIFRESFVLGYPDGSWWWVDPPLPPAESAVEFFTEHVEREGDVELIFDHRIRAWLRICCDHCGTVSSTPALWIHEDGMNAALDNDDPEE